MKKKNIFNYIEYVIMTMCIICFLYGIKSFSIIKPDAKLIGAGSTVTMTDGGGGGTRNTSPTATSTASKPCCDTCEGNTYCLANCQTCSTPTSTATASATATPTPTPSPCAEGTYGTPGSCETCPKGYKCEGGETKVTCSGRTEYQDETGQSECKRCEQGYIATPIDRILGVMAHTDCEAVPVHLESNATGRYLALGESTNHAITTYNHKYTLGSIVHRWYLNGEGFEFTKQAEMGATVGFDAKEGGEGSSCKPYKATVTGTGPGGKDIITFTDCVYCSSWKSYNGHWKKEGRISFNAATTTAGCIFFSGDDGEYYSTAWIRCCGVTPPPDDYGYCYGNEPYLGIATDVAWYYSNSDPDPQAIKDGRPFKYPHSMAANKAECVKMENSRPCNPILAGKDQLKEKTSKCEDIKQIKLSKNDTSCSGEGLFYSISCGDDISTKFDYGSDNYINTVRELYSGQAFDYSIDINTTTTCSAVFYPDVWKNVYNRVMNKMKKVWSISEGGKTAYDIYQLNNAVEYEKYRDHLIEVDNHTKETASYVMNLYNDAREIEKIVRTYNEYPLDDTYDESAKMTLKYNNKDIEDTSIDFIKSKEETGSKDITVVLKHDIGVKWLQNPSNYIIKRTRKVELLPQKTVFDENTGKKTLVPVSLSETELEGAQSIIGVDGGNKIYVDYDVKKGDKIKLEIMIEGLGGKSSNSSISNNACEILIVGSEYEYRRIDVSNPFINSNWQKGENWVNSQYDFTKTIHTNTWSENKIASINISSEQISDIQQSNAKYIQDNDSPYLGVCDRINPNRQDNISKKICSLLKETFK